MNRPRSAQSQATEILELSPEKFRWKTPRRLDLLNDLSARHGLNEIEFWDRLSNDKNEGVNVIVQRSNEDHRTQSIIEF